MSKIAVAYGAGVVFQHFGRTEFFKIYDVEDGKVLSSEIIETGSAGHEALAGFLAERDVDIVICGGLGSGAQNALDEAGIVVISGAYGDADQAVASFLAGELQSESVNCSHHEEEAAEGCGGGCGSGCGGCAGGGCGGCGEPVIILEGRNAGKTVTVHYRGTFNDGSQFDSSYDRDEPMTFISGAGMMIPGFDKAVVDMEPGQTVEIHLMPEEAYGAYDPNGVITVEQKMVQGCEVLKVGDQVALTDSMGRRIPVKVTEKDDVNITFDTNHEMAGKELNFVIELISVQE